MEGTRGQGRCGFHSQWKIVNKGVQDHTLQQEPVHNGLWEDVGGSRKTNQKTTGEETGLDPRRKRTDVKKHLGPESILKPPRFADRLDAEREQKRGDLETRFWRRRGLAITFLCHCL